MDTSILLALIAAVPPTLAALGALVIGLQNRKKVESLHILVNSRLTELLAESVRAATAEGTAVGLAQGRAEQEPTRSP